MTFDDLQISLAATLRRVASALNRLILVRRQLTMTGANDLSNPPWKKTVTDILQKNLDDGHKESLNFALATIKSEPYPRPAVRTVVFRGFVGETREIDHPSKLPGGNPPAESSLILVSTDALMAKVRELENSNGAFEVCWRHAGTNQQIRFHGTAHIYRRNGIEFPEVHLNRYIRTDADWTWERERDRLWKSHKPAMRGSFRNPLPGTPLNEEKKKKLEIVELDAEDDSQDAREAKERFSLVVLEVTEIEVLDLDPLPGVRRRWTLVGSSEGAAPSWEITELCP